MILYQCLLVSYPSSSNFLCIYFGREEQLQHQLAIHKEAIYELYSINQKLRSTLK
jgi:hypothetical protein